MPKKVVKETEPVPDELQAVEISTKDPRTLLLLLDSSEPSIQYKAVNALKKYMELAEHNCVELEELGVLTKLTNLLVRSDEAVRPYAAMCLCQMSKYPAIRRNLRKGEHLSALLPLLELDQTVVCHVNVTAILANMAVEYSGKVHLQEGAVLEPMLKLLRVAEDADVLLNLLTAVRSLVEHYECQTHFIELQGITVILSWLNSEYHELQKLALETLECLMRNKECRHSLQEADGLAKITEFIAKQEYCDLHVEALAVLAHCLKDNDNMMALQSSGCLEKLLTVITSSAQEEVKSYAVLAIAHAAEGDKTNCDILHEQGIEKVLLNLLETSSAVTSCCLAITALSCQRTTCKQLIGKEGGIASLVKLLTHEDVQYKSGAVQAIASLITALPSNCKLLAEHEGIEPLVTLLGDTDSLCRMYASRCITEMSTHEFLRVQLITNSPVIEKLSSSLTFNEPSVQLASMEALTILSIDHEARLQFSETTAAGGGIEAVLELLQSSCDETRGVACQLMASLANSSTIAEAAIEKNVLELLSDLVKHPKLATLAQRAVDRVLDSNLSAKYWQSGQLKHSDIIKDGFFDAGQARPGEKHPTLKELLQKPLLLNRPVLYISLQPCKADNLSDDMPSEASATSVSSKETRSKSRGGKEIKGKKSKQQQQLPTAATTVTDKETREENSEVDTSMTFPADPTLLAYIAHVKQHIQPLPAIKDQVITLAIYVSDTMGGDVKELSSFNYELVNGQAQYKEGSNLIPLGAVNKGLFRHRALLYKVLCDSVGLICSLQCSQYGRVWNTVILSVDDNFITYVVDLVYHPGRLMPDGGPEAIQYQTV